MKFSELPEGAKFAAREALSTAVCMNADAGVIEFERLGEAIAAAFVKMEHHDSAPDVCDDGIGA